MTDSDTELPVIRTDRVRFAETDAQGIVFYGTYFTYMDEAFNALLRAIDYRYERMHEEGWTTHVAHADFDYHAAARFEDVIESRLGTVRIGEIGFTAAFEVHREETGAEEAGEAATDKAETGELIASGSVVHVAADRETGEAIRVPADFREAVAAYRTEPSE